jgi:hypothetical protein
MEALVRKADASSHSYPDNTPVWVFPLLAYLIWQGWQSLRPRTARGDGSLRSQGRPAKTSCEATTVSMHG